MRQAKERMIKEKNLAKATDEYIEATYLISMYESDACVKYDPREVSAMLKNWKVQLRSTSFSRPILAFVLGASGGLGLTMRGARTAKSTSSTS